MKTIRDVRKALCKKRSIEEMLRKARIGRVKRGKDKVGENRDFANQVVHVHLITGEFRNDNRF